MIRAFKKPAPRLPRRHVVTICAGFNCPEGIVLCADSEETVGDFLKRSQPKVVIYPAGKNLSGGDADEVRAVFACAGDGPFIDMMVEKLWRKMASTEPAEENAVVEALEDELIAIHQRYWPLYDKSQRPEVEMLIALYTPWLGSPKESPSLWRADGPVLRRVRTYDCIGYGTSLGKYIGDRLYNGQIETDRAALLAIYLLEQAKKSVQFCGGESQVVVMTLPGWIQRLTQEYVNKAAEAFSNFEQHSNRLLLRALEFKLNEAELVKSFADFYDNLPALQKEMDELLDRVEQFKRSVSQKSARQQ